MRKLILTSIIILCSMVSSAQIHGYIVDENAAPVSGAVIVLINSSDSTMITSTASGERGVFSFTNKVDEALRINISMLGYAPITIPAKTNMGNISMTTKAIEMENVTVKGTSFVASSDRFTFAISNPTLIAGNDAVGILKLTPLLQASENGVSIIGASTTKLYVNGKEIKLGGASLNNYLKGIPAEDIVKIEVMPIANSTFKGQGNFGVVNVILRKKETNGVKGSFSLSDKQAYYNKQNATLAIQGRKDKFGIDASFWGGNNPTYGSGDAKTLFSESGNTIMSNYSGSYDSQDFGTWIGMDYNIDDKQTIGLIVSGDFNWDKTNANNKSIYGIVNSTSIDSVYHTNNSIKTPERNLNANLNYQVYTDSNGSSFTIDVDYINFYRSQHRITTFNKLDDLGVIEKTNTINQSNPLNINIWSGKAQYTHNFKKYGSLSVGLDNYTTSYNNKYSDNSEGISKDNQFLFTEAISSAFASYSNSWTNTFSTTVGFRLENTYAKGHQIINDEKFDKNKTRFLPTIYINYAVSKNNNLSYALSNRLIQPSYSSLNPFKRYSSPTSYSVGNPYLEASNYLIQELTYTFKGKLMVQGSAFLGNNISGSFTLPEGENGTKTITENYGKRQQYKLTVGMYGSYFNDIWQANNSIIGYYTRFRGSVDDMNINNQGLGWMIYLQNDFTLSKSKQITLQTYFQYDGISKTQTGEMDPLWQLNMGLRKAFKNCSLSLYATDIFNTYKPKYKSNFLGIIENGKSFSDNQGVSLYFSYNFGNMKTKENRYRNTSSGNASGRL